MALINCPECNKEVSDQSDKCISCGYPLINHTVVKDTIIDTVSKEETTTQEENKGSMILGMILGSLMLVFIGLILTAITGSALLLAIPSWFLLIGVYGDIKDKLNHKSNNLSIWTRLYLIAVPIIMTIPFIQTITKG